MGRTQARVSVPTCDDASRPSLQTAPRSNKQGEQDRERKRQMYQANFNGNYSLVQRITTSGRALDDTQRLDLHIAKTACKNIVTKAAQDGFDVGPTQQEQQKPPTAADPQQPPPSTVSSVVARGGSKWASGHSSLERRR